MKRLKTRLTRHLCGSAAKIYQSDAVFAETQLHVNSQNINVQESPQHIRLDVLEGFW